MLSDKYVSDEFAAFVHERIEGVPLAGDSRRIRLSADPRMCLSVLGMSASSAQDAVPVRPVLAGRAGRCGSTGKSQGLG
jgi:hypothetical protein